MKTKVIRDHVENGPTREFKKGEIVDAEPSRYRIALDPADEADQKLVEELNEMLPSSAPWNTRLGKAVSFLARERTAGRDWAELVAAQPGTEDDRRKQWTALLANAPF